MTKLAATLLMLCLLDCQPAEHKPKYDPRPHQPKSLEEAHFIEENNRLIDHEHSIEEGVIYTPHFIPNPDGSPSGAFCPHGGMWKGPYRFDVKMWDPRGKLIIYDPVPGGIYMCPGTGFHYKFTYNFDGTMNDETGTY